ncbi:hypothetical protein [uncultured Corynebacterium sp.]|uniref:hypothetical protein n=1 Tax=uncultured Corynebacterium sp. TaxID=159447 RepID=UPI00288C1998|nr:hypothetical protein [uncultured Corynebacterium sp.]
MLTVDDLLNYAPPIQDGLTPPGAARHALDAAEGFVEAYTRGRHLTPTGDYRPGVRGVVLNVAARMLANPGGLNTRVQAGAVSVSKQSGFEGFTLAEQSVLNRYRKRAL